MGTDEGALAALDADVRLPDRNVDRDVPLLVLGGAGRPGAVLRYCGDGQRISLAGNDLGRHLPDELGGIPGNRRLHFLRAGHLLRDRHLDDALQGPVHRGVVHLNELLPLLAVGLLDLGLDGPDRFILGEDPRNDEESGLHDHVDPRPEADFFGQGNRVDDVELHLLGDELLLHLCRQGVPDGLFGVRGGEQENRPFLCGGEEIILFDERGIVTGDEVGRRDQIGVVQFVRSEAEMGGGQGTGFLRVVDEIALDKVVRFGADDLEGVLVGAHGAVGAEPEEKGPENVLPLHLEGIVEGQAGSGHIVVDADRKMVLRRRSREVVEDGLDHGGSKLLGPQAVSSADDLQTLRESGDSLSQSLIEGRPHVEVEGLTDRPRFLGAVEDSDGLDASGDGFEEGARGEWPIEPYLNQPELFPPAFSTSTVLATVSPAEPMMTITRSASGSP